MSGPNLVNVATITGKSVTKVLTGSASDILENPAASNKLFKINNIRLTNFDGTINYDGTINIYKAATGVTVVHGFHTVPAKGAQKFMDKSETLYLEEGDKLTGFGSTTLKLNATVSYEELS